MSLVRRRWENPPCASLLEAHDDNMMYLSVDFYEAETATVAIACRGPSSSTTISLPTVVH